MAVLRRVVLNPAYSPAMDMIGGGSMARPAHAAAQVALNPRFSFAGEQTAMPAFREKMSEMPRNCLSRCSP